MATSPSDAEVAAVVAALMVLQQRAVNPAPAPQVPAWRWGEGETRPARAAESGAT